MPKLRLLVVDDTIVYRKIVSDILAELPGVEVVGTAANGKIALAKMASLQPDLITLDIEMPEMNGIEVLSRMRDTPMNIGAIVLSTLTRQGGNLTIKALELGAFDFIPKPDLGTMARNKAEVKAALAPMIRAYARSREIKTILSGDRSKSAPAAKKQHRPPLPAKGRTVAERMRDITDRKSKSEIVVVGISTGGPSALAKMIPEFPANIGVPILIAQHMPPIFTESMAKSLNAKAALTVKEARDGDLLEPNTVLIAPGGKQMKVTAGADASQRIVRITDDPPENSCKPSADYLFRSVARLFGDRATGVIMTGMGADGKLGAQMMKQARAFIIAQDEASSTVFGMPKEIIDTGTADLVVPLHRMARQIIRTIKD